MQVSIIASFLDKQTEALRVISNSEVSKVTRQGLKPGTRDSRVICCLLSSHL